MRLVKFAIALYLAMITAVALPAQSAKLTPPAAGKIQVAVAISDGAVMIDFAGPWEVFSDVMLHTKGQAHEELHPFHLYTVAESAKAIRTSGACRSSLITLSRMHRNPISSSCPLRTMTRQK